MQYTHTYEVLVAVADAQADSLIGLRCEVHVVSSRLSPLILNRPLLMSMGKIPETETFGFPVTHMTPWEGEATLHLVERFLCGFLVKPATPSHEDEEVLLYATDAKRVNVVVLSSEGDTPVIAESVIQTERRLYSRAEYVRYLKEQLESKAEYTYTLQLNPVKHTVQAFV